MRKSQVHAAESVSYLNRALAKLQDIWEEIGIPEEQRMRRTNDVHKHIKGLLDLMIIEEQDLKQRLLKTIESCQKELSLLCSELQLPPYKEEEGCTILQMEKNCRTRLDVMKGHKTQRMEDLKGLLAKDRELCDIMCTTPFSVDQHAVPSVKQLEAYRTYLDELTKEKEHRHDEFVRTKKEIIACMNDLEQNPETSFEMDVMCEDEEAFCLSNDNITAMKLLLSQLQERKTENELLCSSFRTKIQELWERLQVPQEERESFSEHMLSSKKKNVEALQAEVQRLELLKMHSMKSFIEAIRVEIAVWWKKCFYSDEQQHAFIAFYDDDFTEEILNLHEDEVRTLKKYHEDHKELFEGVTKWQDNWNLYLELDRKANDPSRFTNRGGNLLKEEKQRTELQKSLPKLEKVLKAQIDSWEEEHSKEFLVNGQKFLEYVQQQWKEHHEKKEKEKLERQMKKTKQIQEDMLYGTMMRTPTKRRIAGTPTPGKMRKMNSTSTFSTPSSSLGGTICQTPSLKPPLSASKSLRTPGHGNMMRGLDRNKENLSHLRNPPGGTSKSQDVQDLSFTINSIAGSYSEFARDLSKAATSSVETGLLNSTVSHQ
ncbi:protein regulator of cytokinesis 1-like [Gambusia affinis]|uniref:protein regulator of cytokinesis 1-like n=1 Tax=Gambusia affinis TaxID=33528 RepID=UPI001CDC4D38|nr:protein regulator of cytokinesis 1-like [Gambusia affinis]